jgi:hypothetical protein
MNHNGSAGWFADLPAHAAGAGRAAGPMNSVLVVMDIATR